MIDINSIPLPALWGAEAISWLVLLLRMLVLYPKRLRSRVAAGVVIGVLLMQGLGFAQRIQPRTVAVMAMIVALSLASSMWVMHGLWMRSLEASEASGARSQLSRKLGKQLAYGLIGIMAVFAAAFLVLFKGAGW